MPIKRRGLRFAAALVAIGGVLRVAGPPTTPSVRRSTDTNSKKGTAIHQAGTGHGETSKDKNKKETGNKKGGKGETNPFLDELNSAVLEFCKAPEGSSVRANRVAPGRCSSSRFLIATLPDPLHTHLALVFDRGIEDLQQAVQAKGYVLERATLPWDHAPHPENSDFEKRRQEEEVQKTKESNPGLLIFRRPAPKSAEDAAAGAEQTGSPELGPLFVLIVGETPTSGVHRKQFQNALAFIDQARITTETVEKSRLILGPSFSGSFDSLKQELNRHDLDESQKPSHRPPDQTYVYSGTVTDADSMTGFELSEPGIHFASFQENDEFVREQFIQFACSNDYPPKQIAILSEGETQFGAQDPSKTEPSQLISCKTDYGDQHQDIVRLRFPRQIAYFRSAYQKEIAAAAQQKSEAKLPGTSTLHLDSDEAGNDDESVSPYAVGQNPLSQEAVMLGIVSALQKHHIKFTILYATDPADQLFLARYLRSGYPQGRVVITDPDLLLGREEDALLRGVMAINAYALVPGLSDRLCGPIGAPQAHDDRLFVSGLSVGTYNAMIGLLAVDEPKNKDWKAADDHRTIPPAPYDGYASPHLKMPPSQESCKRKPLLWLTALGRDGFWPIAGITTDDVTALERRVPIAYLPSDSKRKTTLRDVATLSSTVYKTEGPRVTNGFPQKQERTRELEQGEKKERYTPGSWKIAYAICVLLMLVHTILSLTGSVLADSEARTQFANTREWRGAAIVALGGLTLATAFVTIMFTATPKPPWENFWSAWWLPVLVFVPATLWDLGKTREQDTIRGKNEQDKIPGRDKIRTQGWVALCFAVALTLSVGWQVMAWYPLPFDRIENWVSHSFLATSCWLHCSIGYLKGERISVYWSTRILHLSSGLSPVFPVLLLLAAGYWWMWHSLRGIALVDLRRPRLPLEKDLASFSYRLSEREAEQLRAASHPFVFTWQIWVAILGLLLCVSLTVLDWGHPVQTVEGKAYDWGYASLLALMIAAFLNCLMKLVWTWLKCQQILAALDRLPLREAFSRMKGLSWHSMWNPGGSTVRETYKLMARGAENLTRLKAQIQDWRTPMSEAARRITLDQIEKITGLRQTVLDIRELVLGAPKDEKRQNVSGKSGKFSVVLWTASIFSWIKSLLAKIQPRYKKYREKRENLDVLTKCIEDLQSEMAKMTAKLISEVLRPQWDEETAPVLSEDEKAVKAPLSPLRILSEEYAALTYLNFLVTVLLRMRTLVICAAGIYVFVVLSTSVYPFEPHPALQTLAIVLLAAMGVAVAYVYAGMHREAILSRLTSNESGELGWDFWLKLIAAGAIPVFSLLAVQFPSIGQVLFSWLEPALEAVK